MNPILLDELCKIVDGELLWPWPLNACINGVCTDSRAMAPGTLFIAIRGEKHDGHEHLVAAYHAGAMAALVEERKADAPRDWPMIGVANTRIAMGKLAAHVRRQLRGKVIGVAGSNGKTGTKYLINSALRGAQRGSFSPKSFNNDIGVPLAIFPASPAQDYLVLEIGTNHPGEVLNLTKIAQPDVAVITNCSAEHLEFLGDLEGVRAENASIIAGLRPDGWLLVNGDDPQLLNAISAHPRERTLTFGFQPSNNLFAFDIRTDGTGTRFLLNGRTEVFVPLLGRHNAINALAALVVARQLGVSEATAIEGLATADAPEMRLELKRVGGVTVLNDAYNANPASMKAALETLAGIETKGRRIAVLGDMRELGVTTERYHRELGEFAGKSGIDVMICVGENGALFGEAARGSGATCEIKCFTGAGDAATDLARWIGQRDIVLLKGSRAMRLEAVAKALEEREVTPL